MKGIEPGKIDISPIHHQKRAGLGDNHIEQMNVVDFGVSDIDKNGNGAVNFHQCVKLDGSLGSLVAGPGKNTQTQIDGGGVQSINGTLQIQSKIAVGVQGPSDVDQSTGKVCIDSPI